MRQDISKKLIHFVRGETFESAFETILRIVEEGVLRGGTNAIRGDLPCVCFTEAPLAELAQGFIDLFGGSDYTLFGFMTDKSWIHSLGGRHVIYQPNYERNLLDDKVKWRHVRYEPNADPPIDWTWQREWRLQTAELPISPEHFALLAPDRAWADRIANAIRESRYQMYSQIMDELLATQYAELECWQVTTFSDD